jgi:hypothetical protein
LFEGKAMTMRTFEEIKQELSEAADRRAELWKSLSVAGADETTSAEIALLNARIEGLWQEYRLAKSRARFGEQELIRARARAEDRLDRDLARVA